MAKDKPYDHTMSAQVCGCDAGAGHTCVDHQFQSPESSNILGALFNPALSECIITFKTKGGSEPARRYRGTIPSTVFDAFKASLSKGGFYVRNMKEVYTWTRL